MAVLAVTSAVALRPDGTTEVRPSLPSATPTASVTAGPSAGTSTAPSAPAAPVPSSTVPLPTSEPTGTSAPEVPPTVTARALVWSVVDRVLVDVAALQLVPDRAEVVVVGADGGPGDPADPADPEVLVSSAVLHLLSEPAPDPDHTNLWAGSEPDPAAVTVDIEDGGTTLDLPASAFAGSVGSEAASLAVQALVRTVVSNGGPAPVTVLVDGRAGAEVWGTVVLDQPLAPSTQDLAGGWILDPSDGQRLRAGTVTLSGTATAFEATVNWAVLDADGATVQEGATESGSNGDYGPWSVPVQLGPGTWTAVLRAENMAGPTEGPGPWLWEETKTFTVVP